MLNWWTYIKEGNTFAGLEICGSEADLQYYLVVVKKVRGELLLESKSELSDLENLNKKINKDTPLFISLNTSNVLLKFSKDHDTKKPEVLVNNSFPNLDLKNFYYEILQIDSKAIITICKRIYLEDILDKLSSFKISVVGYSLGISPIQAILPYSSYDSITTTSQKLVIDDGLIVGNITRTDNLNITYDINGISLPNTYILSFSVILNHISKNKTISNFSEKIQQFRLNYSDQRIFSTLLKSALIFFIGILSINFFLFNSYHEKVNSLRESLAANSSQKDRLLSKENSLKVKKERVETVYNSVNSQSTLYLDELAQSIPNGILLSSTIYQPLAKPVQDSKPIELDEKTVMVSGISIDDTLYSNWLENLEKMNWISNVETMDYEYVDSKTSSFLIKIKINGN
ncbi:PilN domain-containing protein [Maribacter polysiphoniae]|uniref:PilN domain-containing protein n=1 Tax=Maribacter polysiphoniae TaxID=429344 RepID=A0A316DZD1_9FLAO|nr:PilN domain-containing protein [Maribacter polysiphoniae]MBD1261613.1 PilN domain-containing protein [Maribacter polysiphoniae]PWK22589.1 hypothetical protein LX92_03064 [Maribacter polysiphoniae]